MSKRCLFIYDQHGWAWDFMTRGIIKNLPDSWTGEKFPIGDIRFLIHNIHYKEWWNSHDAIWFWNPNLLFHLLKSDERKANPYSDIPPYPAFLDTNKIEFVRENNITVGHYGSSNTEGRILWSTQVGVRHNAFICQKYYDLAMKVAPQFKDRYNIVHPAVDTEIFYPNPKPHTGFIVGWAGHANWEYKRTYLLDQIKFPIKMQADWGEKYFIRDRPFEYMADFYNACDAYISVSKQEAIPQPILEASACGLPVLSTDVGGISDFLDKEFLCPPYPENEVVKFMNEKLAEWEKNPELRREIGLRNLKKVMDDWNWKNRTKQIIKEVCEK